VQAAPLRGAHSLTSTVTSLAWQFSSNLFQRDQRITGLSAPPDFATIVDKIPGAGQLLCSHEEQATDMKTHFRAVYCIDIGRPLFDLLYNSVNGYRAAYFI